MCWRDDVPRMRHCSLCGADYYGDLGHRFCPKREPTKLPEFTLPEPVAGEPDFPGGCNED